VQRFDEVYWALINGRNPYSDYCFELPVEEQVLERGAEEEVESYAHTESNSCVESDGVSVRGAAFIGDPRFDNIRKITNQASQARYLASQDPEIILANLIMQILEETEGTATCEKTLLDDLCEAPRKLEEVLPGFEFYDNNPYRAKAEKRLAKLRRKQKRAKAG